MKAFVFGALLFQTLNAQVSDDSDLTGVEATAEAGATASVEAVASAVSQVAEGFDDLASAISSVVAEASLPVGTADVIIDVSTDSSSVAEPTPTFDEFTFPSAEASAGAGLEAADATASDDFVVGSDPTATDEFPAATDAVDSPAATDAFGFPVATDEFGSPVAEPTEAASPDSGVTPDAASEDPFAPAPDFGAGADATVGAGADAAAASDEPLSPIPDETAGAAEATDLPGDGSGVAAAPPQPGDTIESSSTVEPTATNSVDALADPALITPGAVSGGSGVGAQGAIGAQAAVGAAAYAGGDNGNYDGQDYPYDEADSYSEDCPAYCYDDDDVDYDGPYRRTPHRSVRARQEPASGGFAAFDWPDGVDEEDDIPEWLQDSPDAPASMDFDPTNQCPESCYNGYHPQPTSRPPRPTYTRTRRPWTRTHTWHPSPPAPTTTLVTKTRPRPRPHFTSVLTSDVDWTGATLAGVCPKTCNPFNPSLNKCDITTSCATSGGTNYYCACRAGFKAGGWNAKDFSKQFHVDGVPYVYVAPGVVCDKPCDDQTCSEVLTRPKCK